MEKIRLNSYIYVGTFAPDYKIFIRVISRGPQHKQNKYLELNIMKQT